MDLHFHHNFTSKHSDTKAWCDPRLQKDRPLFETHSVLFLALSTSLSSPYLEQQQMSQISLKKHAKLLSHLHSFTTGTLSNLKCSEASGNTQWLMQWLYNKSYIYAPLSDDYLLWFGMCFWFPVNCVMSCVGQPLLWRKETEFQASVILQNCSIVTNTN